jgi:hypothetical protein
MTSAPAMPAIGKPLRNDFMKSPPIVIAPSRAGIGAFLGAQSTPRHMARRSQIREAEPDIFSCACGE